MKPVPLAVLTRARHDIVENAQGLLDDSRHLLVDGRFCRSLALSVFAREELGKLAIVVRTVYRLRVGADVDWSDFKKRTRDHYRKLKITAFIETIYSSNLYGHPDVKAELLRLGRQPALGQWLDDKRQDGLHVRVTAMGVQTPLHTVSRTDAQQVYESTAVLLQYFTSGESYDPADSVLFGIVDYYGKVIALADDLCEDPEMVILPR